MTNAECPTSGGGAVTTWTEWQARHVAATINRARTRNREFTVSHDQNLAEFLANVPTPAETESPTGPASAERAKQAVDRLRPRAARAVRLRFGLEGGEARTLVEVGEAMGFTRERARQVIGQAMEELRELVGIAA